MFYAVVFWQPGFTLAEVYSIDEAAANFAAFFLNLK